MAPEHKPTETVETESPLTRDKSEPLLDLARHGRITPEDLAILSATREARMARLARTLEMINAIPDTDPPGTDEAFMRAIDANRPDHPLFKGMY